MPLIGGEDGGPVEEGYERRESARVGSVEVTRIAYRFVPAKPDGGYSEGSRYTLICSEPLSDGAEVAFEVKGYAVWEVVKLQKTVRERFAVTDKDGVDIPLAGTAYCRGLR